MANAELLQGNWEEVRDKMQGRWSQLAGEEFNSFDGNLENLVSTMQRKTGESKEAIENFLNEACPQSSQMFSGAIDSAKHYAQETAATVRRSFSDGAEVAGRQFDEVKEGVRQHPVESLVATFGVGMALGLLLVATSPSK